MWDMGYLLETGVYRLPTMAVCLVGLVFALNARPKHPETSVRVCLGLGLVLLASVGGWLWYAYLFGQARTGGMGWANDHLLNLGAGFFFTALHAGGIGLVVWAALSGRGPGNTRRPSARDPWDADPPFRPGSPSYDSSDPNAIREEGRY